MGLFHKEEKSEAQKYMEARGKRIGATQPGQTYRRKNAETHTYINGKQSHRSTQNKNFSSTTSNNKPTAAQDIMRSIEDEMRRVRMGIESKAAQNAQQNNFDNAWNSTFDDDSFSARSTGTDEFNTTPRKTGGITVNGVHYDSLKEAWKKSPGFKVLAIFIGGFFILPIVFEVIFAIFGGIIMLLGSLLG